MFTKLRNHFLILNMSITSLVMMAAFAVIYFSTYSSIQAEHQKKLNAQAETMVTISGPEPPPSEAPEQGLVARHMAFEDPQLFSIEVDGRGNILKINSSVSMPEAVYANAAKTAWGHRNTPSPVAFEGKEWLYSVTQMSTQVIRGSGQQYTVTWDKYLITFLDVTESNKTLLRLLTTMLIVGFSMLIAIFIISLYFAGRAIKPIAETWQKQKQFIADASHELKTPISIINANYDALLANREETIDSQMKWLGYIKIGTDRMAKLVGDLLSLAKVEDVHFATQKAPFNISTAVHEVIMSMEAAVNDKGIRLSHSIEPDIIVKSDMERVQQVVTILLDNAIKYTNEHGQIDISLTHSKRHIAFSISNTGKGIPKADVPKVFDRFYRVDPSRTHETGGYGLGLSIAKAIVDRLGGEIHVESEEDGWTTFAFTLGA
ncbi:sensor histidine kinase [Paenibacillus hamazuiensis]|uniref:sensor histidine kinase n=1 Tax=Paenibacillus hamazuiensis TaxID=2936508 RepID=UPI00200C6CB4|nr:HAMP domain-containing sensor histidine kinase [Paenibacillus hamazuiensis]